MRRGTMRSLRQLSERALWCAAGLYLAAIYASLYVLPFLLDLLRRRNVLRLSLAALFLLLALGIVAAARVARAGPRQWAVLLATGAIYALFLSRMEILQERLHIPEYGLLGLLLLAALGRRWRADGPRPRPPWQVGGGALLLATLAGWGDEGIQGLLPNRVYDLRDVAFNAAAAGAAIVAWAAFRAARARDPSSPT